MKKTTVKTQPKLDPKKLVLTKQTIRPLSDHDLETVNGAGPMTYSRCWCQ
jgi:hypothetical protein